jgi:hypothetical protein
MQLQLRGGEVDGGARKSRSVSPAKTKKVKVEKAQAPVGSRATSRNRNN